ncbi:MAG: glycosyltransferase [Deltaproteobacteria bacterium]|nr:glycosyltransferase [Deltaproteobacteria bacterium]
MRLLYVIDSLGVGGAERSLLDIIPRVGVSASILRLSEPGDLDSEFEGAGIKVLRGDLPKRASALTAARLVERTVAVIRPDIVHSTLFRADIAARLACIDAPLISSFVNDSYAAIRYQSLSPRARLKLELVRLVDAATARRACVFVSNSASIARSNGVALHVSNEDIHTIYRGRDLGRFHPPSARERDEARQANGLGDVFVVVTVGRLLARKGHRELLEAFARVRREVPSALLVVGDGMERERLEALRDELVLGDDVRFLGTRHDVATLLRAADLFAFPSHYEGFPGALIEAMASGLPCVATDIEVHREAIVDGENGRLVRVCDPSALATAIVEIATEPKQRARMAARARETALSMFDVNRVAKSYREIYQKVAGKL